MKHTAILALAFIAGCQRSDRSHAIAARPSAGRPASQQPAVAPAPRPYELRGVATDPQLFADQGRCMEALHANAMALDVGIANGSSSNLSCVPV